MAECSRCNGLELEMILGRLRPCRKCVTLPDLVPQFQRAYAVIGHDGPPDGATDKEWYPWMRKAMLMMTELPDDDPRIIEINRLVLLWAETVRRDQLLAGEDVVE